MKLSKYKLMQEEVAAEEAVAAGGSVEDNSPVEEVSFSDSEINDLISEDEGYVDEVVEPEGAEEVSEPEVSEEPVAGEGEVSEEAEVEDVTEEPEAEQPPTPEAEQPTPQEEVQPEEQLSQEEKAAQFEKVREDFRTGLEQMYALTEDDQELMDTEPSKVLPKLAANLHMQVLQGATSGILAQLPALVEAVMESKQVSTSNEDAFFSAYPQLKEHAGVVQRIAGTYRALNPQAPMDQAIREIGTQALVMLQLPIPGMQEAAPVDEAPVTSPPPTPATPGAGTLSSATPQSQRGHNVYTEMAEELLNDDDF